MAIDRQPSKYQEDILAWIRSGKGDAIVEAVAGSGKTTTLEMAWDAVKRDTPGVKAIFLAFNRSVAGELRKRLPGLESRTLHSLGNRPTAAWIGKRPTVDARKYRNLAVDFLRETASGRDQTNRYLAKDLARVVDLARLSLTNVRDENALRAIVERHNIGRGFCNVEKHLHLVGDLCDEGFRLARLGHIDFTDQLWIPALHNLPVERYDWVFVDESQDLNAAQLELVKRSRGPGGRLLFVGDPAQAIYGFAGADAASLRNIQRSLRAKRLPLSITYRCPLEHVAAASQIVVGLEAGPGALPGTFELIDIAAATLLMGPNDLILSREVAPAVALQRYLDDRQTASFVDDPERWKELRGLLLMYKKEGTDPANLEDLLLDLVLRAEASGSKGDYTRIDSIKALLFIISGRFADYSLYHHDVDRVFAPREAAARCLTIHKAKGLEAERVFLIRPDFLPHPYAVQEWQREQEENLLYVALTRAKDKLFICRGQLPSNISGQMQQSEVRNVDGIWGTGFRRLRGQPLPSFDWSPSNPPALAFIGRQHEFHAGVCVHCSKQENFAQRFGWSCG